MFEYSDEDVTVDPSHIRKRMIGILVADSATETNDVDTGLADEAAVERTRIDKLPAGPHRFGNRVRPTMWPKRYASPPWPPSGHTWSAADRSARSSDGIAANKVVDAFRAMGRNRTNPTADVPDGPVLDDGPVQRLLATQLAERLACGVPEPVTRH